MRGIVVALLGGAVAACLQPGTLSAQRFEGIITMKFNAGAGMGARGNRAPGNRAPGNAGRDGAARGQAFDRENAAAEAIRNALAGGVQQIEYMTRRGKVRIALGGGGPTAAAMIYAPDEGVVYTLVPGVSMYAETSLADLDLPEETTAARNGANRAPKAPTIVHTKKFELIAGHRCEHVLFTSGTQKTDICMAKGLGVFVMPPVGGAAAAWDKVLAAENGFPLKVLQPNGTVLMEVVRIERKALGAAMFSVPDSYSRMPDVRRPPGGGRGR